MPSLFDSVKGLAAKLAKRSAASTDWRTVRDQLIARRDAAITKSGADLVGNMTADHAAPAGEAAPTPTEDVKPGDTVRVKTPNGLVEGLVTEVFPDAKQVQVRHNEELRTADGTVFPEGYESTHPLDAIVEVLDTAGTDWLHTVNDLLAARNPAAAAQLAAEHGDHELAAKCWTAADHIAKTGPGSLVKDAMRPHTPAARRSQAYAEARKAVNRSPAPATKAAPPKGDEGKAALTAAFGDVIRARQAQILAHTFALPARPFPDTGLGDKLKENR
jgi:hypothetical protein